MKAYSVDLRTRVMSYVESGGSRISASKIFSIGERTVRRWISLREETKSLEPKPHGGGYPPKIDLKVLKEYVNSNADITLSELGEKFSVSVPSIWHALKKINYVYKKNSSV
jgi:transposase